jgi:hypothetical protein
MEVGSILRSEFGYYVEVVRTSNGELVGKLLCDTTNGCRDSKYALNNGKGFKKVTASEMLRDKCNILKIACSQRAQEVAIDECRAEVNKSIMETNF